jgi:hypothetical protein
MTTRAPLPAGLKRQLAFDPRVGQGGHRASQNQRRECGQSDPFSIAHFAPLL